MVASFALMLAVVLGCCLSLSTGFRLSAPTRRVLRLPRLHKAAPTQEDIAAEKLVYDTKTGRFFESTLDDICAEEFCLMDSETGQPILLTRDEKERIFLDAIQSYYFSGKSGLPDDQFDRLKEDLSWEGSALVALNRDETLFMNAMQAYNKGKPIITDAQFDELKTKLKESGSKLAVGAEPKCYVETGVCKVTWEPDSLRTGSLYVPATGISVLIYTAVVYELLAALDVTLNPVLALLFGAPIINNVSKAVTENVLFSNPEVLKGPCPSCGAENKVFFGSVLGVEGDKEETSIKCGNCKTSLTIKRSTRRVSTLMGKSKGPPAKAAKDDDDDE